MGKLTILKIIGYEDSDPKTQHDHLVKHLYPSGYTKGVKDTHETDWKKEKEKEEPQY